MKIRILLGTTACCLLASCALHHPPSGANILTEAARAQIPGQWSGGHRGGPVVPNWISTFHDPELTRIVEEAIVYNPDLRAAAARVEASRAAVRVAAASLYPRIAAKILGERQGQELGGDIGGGVVEIGITDYAQGELGDVVYIELPKVGASFGKHDVFGTIEAEEAVSELFAPIGGVVVDINLLLAKDPTLVGGQMFSLYDRSVMHAYGETLAKYKWFWGPAPQTVHGHDFAQRHGRIRLIECEEIKYLCQEHLGLDVLISLPKPPPRRR